MFGDISRTFEYLIKISKIIDNVLFYVSREGIVYYFFLFFLAILITRYSFMSIFSIWFFKIVSLFLLSTNFRFRVYIQLSWIRWFLSLKLGCTVFFFLMALDGPNLHGGMITDEWVFWDSCQKCQKQHSRGVFSKRCSEKIKQIYRRTPMPKCDFNKVAK